MQNTNGQQTILSLVRPRLNKATRAYILGLVTGATLVTLLLIFTPPSEPRSESIFIYGTLQNPIIRSITCLCITTPTDSTLVGYQKVGRNIIPDPTTAVHGSIIHVTPNELALLDRYEKVPRKYRRERIEIDGQSHWVYILNEPASSLPASI